MKFKIGKKVRVLTLDTYSNKARMLPTVGKIGIVIPNISEDSPTLIRVSFPNIKDNREGMGWSYLPSSLRVAKLRIG